MATWKLVDAVDHLSRAGSKTSKGRCAQYVREAIEAGGLTLARRGSAKDYGQSLVAVGFNKHLFCPVRFLKGDVVIFDPVEGHPHGHIAMFTGTKWISDFVQRDVYPGPAYRNQNALYTLYRWAGDTGSDPWLSPVPNRSFATSTATSGK